MSQLSNHKSLKHLVTLSKIQWLKIWDYSLERGTAGAQEATYVFNILCRRPLFGDRLCTSCDQRVPDHLSFFEHVITMHLNKDPNDVLHSISKLSEQIYLRTTSTVSLISADLYCTHLSNNLIASIFFLVLYHIVLFCIILLLSQLSLVSHCLRLCIISLYR